MLVIATILWHTLGNVIATEVRTMNQIQSKSGAGSRASLDATYLTIRLDLRACFESKTAFL
jgi:hypothetical protein